MVVTDKSRMRGFVGGQVEGVEAACRLDTRNGSKPSAGVRNDQLIAAMPNQS